MSRKRNTNIGIAIAIIIVVTMASSVNASTYDIFNDTYMLTQIQLNLVLGLGITFDDPHDPVKPPDDPPPGEFHDPVKPPDDPPPAPLPVS